MKAFATLYTALDETNKTNAKLAALEAYFRTAPPASAAWVVYFMVGRRPRQAVNHRKLAEWAWEAAGVPAWLFGESYDAVGDMAETITLILPETSTGSDEPLSEWVARLVALRGMEESEQRTAILNAWRELDSPQRFIWNKLITGGFRVGVSQQLVVRALANASGMDSAVIAHRLMGEWEPTEAFFLGLLAPDTTDSDSSRPYPFFLAYPIEVAEASSVEASFSAQLGERADWQVEWKWDGIRAQLIRRKGQTFLWSRGEELVTERYPEIAQAAERLPNGTVLDGELLVWVDGRVQPFALLQRRIGRKSVSSKEISSFPVILLVYDILEHNGQDCRTEPLTWRRAQVEQLVAEANHSRLLISPLVEVVNWEALAEQRLESRERGVEGFMLKRTTSPYRVGRQRGDWWKWKIDPYTVDAVLIYAQRGSGKRASLYTDYTFGVWDEEDNLVPFAKAYSGLTDEEIRDVDRFIRRNTREQFGPVRTVTPELVFELGFEGIQESKRHKSGIAVRFPRILRWRQDKKAEEADTLETVRALLQGN
jgi:DNA ligase-1